MFDYRRVRQELKCSITLEIHIVRCRLTHEIPTSTIEYTLHVSMNLETALAPVKSHWSQIIEDMIWWYMPLSPLKKQLCILKNDHEARITNPAVEKMWALPLPSSVLSTSQHLTRFILAQTLSHRCSNWSRAEGNPSLCSKSSPKSLSNSSRWCASRLAPHNLGGLERRQWEHAVVARDGLNGVTTSHYAAQASMGL